MFYLAWRNLKQNHSRFWLSAAGVALALSLILALDAIVAGMESQLSAYIESSKADIWVAQSGIQNLHMVSSTLPAAVVDQISEVTGVASVTPILYVTQMVGLGDERQIDYVIGLPKDALMGRPNQIVEGQNTQGSREAIVDQQKAHRAGIGLGDDIRIFGRNFQVVGLSTGLTNPINGVVFVSFEDFAKFRRTKDTVSYVLVSVEETANPNDVAARIETNVEGVSALSRDAFATEERKIIKDMGVEAINIMNAASFTIGLAVLALTIYLTTLSRRAEYGVLRAIGANKKHLYQMVLAQAFLIVVLGFGLALAFTFLLAQGLPLIDTSLNLSLQITTRSVLKAGFASLILASLAALAPIVQVARLDPAIVFRGG